MRTITVHDSYQQNYTYTCIEPMGENFDPEFTPDVSPKEMLELWVFWGKYFSDTPPEFPDERWQWAKLAGVQNTHDKSLNLYGVLASQPLSVWQEKWWIHPDDPRGWFQWYCRYYMWRRHEDDPRQIQRRRMMRRHMAQIQKNCLIPGDPTCRPRQRQALLQWGYDVRGEGGKNSLTRKNNIADQ